MRRTECRARFWLVGGRREGAAGGHTAACAPQHHGEIRSSQDEDAEGRGDETGLGDPTSTWTWARAKRLRTWPSSWKAPSNLERSGWNLNTLKSGDAVTIQGMLARDGSPQIWANSVVLTASNKRVLDVSAAAKAALLPVPIYPRATPRWPDGKPGRGPQLRCGCGTFPSRSGTAPY